VDSAESDRVVMPAGSAERAPGAAVLSKTAEAGPCSLSSSGIPADLPGRWFVAHTRSRNEKALATELTRLRVYNYLPLARRSTRSAATRRLSHSEVPVFPGYLFFNGSEDDRYLALRTNRIAKVLEVFDQTQLVAELRRVHLLLSQTNGFEVANRLAVGDWGRIRFGPLQGLEGVVIQYAGRLRLWMNVTILGQSVHTQVDAESVERIAPPGPEASCGSSGVCVR